MTRIFLAPELKIFFVLAAVTFLVLVPVLETFLAAAFLAAEVFGAAFTVLTALAALTALLFLTDDTFLAAEAFDFVDLSVVASAFSFVMTGVIITP